MWSELNKHMDLHHGIFYSARCDSYVALRGAEGHVSRQPGAKSFRPARRSSSSVSAGSQAVRPKVPRADRAEAAPGKRRCRRIALPTRVLNQQGVMSVTVAAGPPVVAVAPVQGGGGTRMAGKALPTATGREPTPLAEDASTSYVRPASPASSDMDDLGPNPDVQLDVKEVEMATEEPQRDELDDLLPLELWSCHMVVEDLYRITPDVATQCGERRPQTAEAATQWQGPATVPPSVTDISRPPMAMLDVLSMARSYWLQGPDEIPAIVQAVVDNFTTDRTVEQLINCLDWAHAGRRDLAMFLFHWLGSECRDGRSPEVMMRSLWQFLSRMQR